MKIKRNVLLNPGPATTTDTVKLAQVVPDICPREKEFQNVMESVSLDLLKVIDADPKKYVAVLFAGSGTISIDSMISSLVSEKGKILVINNGSYSKRAVDVCRYYGLPFIEIKYLMNELPNLSEVEELIKNNHDVELIYTTHHETGTGLLNPIREIGKIAHKYNKIFGVDTTSTYAMIPLNMAEDNVDFIMSSSQKGIGAMSGVAFVIGNRQIIEKTKDYPKRSYYTNLYRQYEYFEKTGQMHFTPPVQTLYSVRRALDELFAETLENKIKRHNKTFQAIYSGMKELGFKFYVDKDKNAGVLLSMLYPEDPNFDFTKVHDYCYEKGYTIYPGKVIDLESFRLSVFGAIDENDISEFLKVFKDALIKYDVKIPVK